MTLMTMMMTMVMTMMAMMMMTIRLEPVLRLDKDSLPVFISTSLLQQNVPRVSKNVHDDDDDDDIYGILELVL